MRPRAKRKISCAGHDVGKCTRIIVFISTTRAAILIRRLAASAGAYENANRNRGRIMQPLSQLADLAVTSEQRDDVGAVGAQQRDFRGASRREFAEPHVLRQTQLGPPRLNGHAHDAVDRLNDNVVVAEYVRVLGGRSHRTVLGRRGGTH
jgi:hypothetical protein